MSDNPYIKAKDFIKINNTDMNSTDPEVITNVIKDATSPYDIINAIENYNNTHKLSLRNRIRYGIGIGETYLTVISATKVGDFYKVISQDYNGRPKVTAENGKVTSAQATFHTHFIPASAITDVVVSGYDPAIMNPIIANAGVDEIDVNKILTDMRKMVQDFNTMLSSGQIRNYIKKFNYEFSIRKLNDITYEHNIQLYNMYNQLSSQYLLVIKNIVENALDLGKVTSPINLRDKPVYFIGDANLKEHITAKIEELFKLQEDKAQYDSNFDSRYMDLIQKTFTNTEIEWFKDVIKE